MRLPQARVPKCKCGRPAVMKVRVAKAAPGGQEAQGQQGQQGEKKEGRPRVFNYYYSCDTAAHDSKPCGFWRAGPEVPY